MTTSRRTATGDKNLDQILHFTSCKN